MQEVKMEACDGVPDVHIVDVILDLSYENYLRTLHNRTW